MNIIETNPINNDNEYVPSLEELRNTYLFAGLTPTNALEAALADLADLFSYAA